MRIRSRVGAAAVCGALFLTTVTAWGQAPGTAAKPQGKVEGMPDLVGALKATPGCLGVETAKTSSGKQVIFAWFEDRKAVVKWYYSDTHRHVMNTFFPEQKYPKPLANVAEGGGPIMLIASITMADKPMFKETPLPISQIAIELYQPLPGGTSLGGRFAPAKLQIPHHRTYESKDK